jgi:bifunctional enzyme CysN/CysC/sulfate adenylyltransferase subunit 1
VTLVLEDDVDASRGDMLIGLDDLPGKGSELRARVCWMNPRPLQAGRKYYLKHTTQTVQSAVTSIDHRVDIRTYEHEEGAAELNMNDIGEIRLRTSRQLIYDAYEKNRLTGSFILVEQGTNQTVGAGMLRPAIKPFAPDYDDFAI